MLVSEIKLSDAGLKDAFINAYLKESDQILPFISSFPSVENILKQAEIKSSHSIDRKLLVEVLLQQNTVLTDNEYSERNIRLLSNPNCFTITTGHQLCLFTGPAYFLYKIVSAIALCRKLKAMEPHKDFVPVFWMASEDHDADEINHVVVNDQKLEWPVAKGPACGDLLTTGLNDIIDHYASLIGNNEFVMKIIREAYDGRKNLSAATAAVVHHLFGKFGLVILDANNKGLKRNFVPVMEDEMFHQSSESLVQKTNEKLLDLGYKPQVHPRPINFFMLQSDARRRIEKEKNKWRTVGSDHIFDESEMQTLLQNSPEVFSPNVVLRPVYQEFTLPNIAYIGGPGEISYWCQLKSVFEHHHVPFPILVMRDSALVISKKSISRLQKLGLSPQDLFLGMDQLILDLLKDQQVNLSRERDEITSIYEGVINTVASVDKTLEATARAELQRSLGAVEMLEKKMLKAIKQKEEVRIGHLEKLFQSLFPGNNWQERSENGLAYVAEYGASFLDELIDKFDPLNKTIKFMIDDAPGKTEE